MSDVNFDIIPERIGSPGKEGPAVVNYPAPAGKQSKEGSQDPKPFGKEAR